MINTHITKKLNIILPNTNKALKEVLKSVSATDLATLSKGKDLSSIIDTLLQQSINDSKGNKLLLQALKTNPTFKELGNISKNMQTLLETLKKEQTSLPLERKLNNFLENIKNIDAKSFHTKIENSGVFLENRLKNIQTPQIELKNKLQELSNYLQNTKLPNIKAINIQIMDLLSSKLFKNISKNDILQNVTTDIQLLTQMSQKVQTVLDSLTRRINSAVDKTLQSNDVLFSQKSTTLLKEIKHLNKLEVMQNQTQIKNILSHDLKAILLKAHDEIQSTNTLNKGELLKHIERLTLQIDYHQLLSHLSNASSFYIPYSWNLLEDGNITMQQTNDNKFFTDIELTLKDYGELKLRLGMFEKNQLNMNIKAQSPELKKIIQDNIASLKKQLLSVGVVPVSIRFIDDDTTLSTAYHNQEQAFKTGFEAKA